MGLDSGGGKATARLKAVSKRAARMNFALRVVSGVIGQCAGVVREAGIGRVLSQ